MYFQRATQCVVRERGGEFPTSAAGWRQLPGIGAYTAGALASILNGEPVPAVDGNVRRVLARMHLVEGSRNDPDAARAIDMFAAASVPASSPGDYNQALMELGARVCTPRRPRCHLCPVAADCRAHAAGRATEVPAPRRAKKTPRRVVAAAMIEDRGRLLLVRRPDNGLLAGFWEFPGVVVRRGEKAERSLERAVMKSCGLRVRAGRRLGTVKHAYSHFELTLRVFECTPVRARTQTSSVANGGTVRGGGARWVPRGSLDRYAIHGAMKKAFAAIGERSNVRKETGRSG
jgi:A/G-specific adenine glycosylase